VTCAPAPGWAERYAAPRTLIVLHGTDRVGTVSWRKVQTGPTASNWAIGIGLAPEFRGRGYGSEA
jgi:RimJ/RimL family protein N-acetyltransferase